jgi:hypothetical protein
MLYTHKTLQLIKTYRVGKKGTYFGTQMSVMFARYPLDNANSTMIRI